MIEGGGLTMRTSDMMPPRRFRDTLAFDEAVGGRIGVSAHASGYLLMVTTINETGGIGNHREIARRARTTLGSTWRRSESAEPLSRWSRVRWEDPTSEKVREVVKSYLAIEISDDEARTVISDPIRTLDPYKLLPIR